MFHMSCIISQTPRIVIVILTGSTSTQVIGQYMERVTVTHDGHDYREHDNVWFHPTSVVFIALSIAAVKVGTFAYFLQNTCMIIGYCLNVFT